MDILFIVTLLATTLILSAPYMWYVAIISRRNKALEALSSVDVQLKMRLDLIPNILAIAKRFMEHELSLMTNITTLRTQAAASYDPKDAAAVQQHLNSIKALDTSMGQFMVQVEAYPALKSDETMLQAQRTYNEVEAQIAAARRFYNAGVNALNNSVQIFPGNLIAGIAGVSAMPFYEAEAAAQQSINAKDYL